MSKATELATRARRIQKILSANETTDTMRVIEFCAESATELDRLQAIEDAAKTLRAASGVVLAAQIRTHGDGKSLSLPLPKEYASEMNAAMLAQAELYRLLDAGELFNTDAQRLPAGRTD